MKKATPNPINGFLESKQSFPSRNVRKFTALTAEKKQDLLNIARDFTRATQRIPNIAIICDELNISVTSFYDALKTDNLLQKEYKDILSTVSQHYISKLADKAEKDSGIIANLAMLKYLETGSFVDRLNVKQTVNYELNKTVYDAIKVDIDPEIPHLQTIPNQKLGSYEVVDTQPFTSASNAENKQ